MTREKSSKFSRKHGRDARVKPELQAAIEQHAKNDQMACAVAFKIASEMEVPPLEIGKALDLLEIKLVKCQLGLFGYQPDKKIVPSQSPDNPQLEKAIRAALVDGKLPCERAWELARIHGVSKMAVSALCEARGIKIKPCQLGAF